MDEERELQVVAIQIQPTDRPIGSPASPARTNALGVDESAADVSRRGPTLGGFSLRMSRESNPVGLRKTSNDPERLS